MGKLAALCDVMSNRPRPGTPKGLGREQHSVDRLVKQLAHLIASKG